MYSRLKIEIATNLRHLYELGLMPWSSGNISIREKDYILIKASGIPYHKVSWSQTPQRYNKLVVALDMDGNSVEDGGLKPSVDTPIHLGIYRRRPDIRAIVHTHSTYATAFAAMGSPIPCLTTMQADIFGGDIYCGAAFLDDCDSVAAAIVATTLHCPAMLLKRHGVFTVGNGIEEAVKAAVLVEEVAKIGFLARQARLSEPLSGKVIARLHERYQEEYGQ